MRLVELYLERTGPPDQPPPALQSVSNALFKWILLYQAIHLLSAYAVVITTPGDLAKFMVALDLWFDFMLTCTAKLSICVLVQWMAHKTLYWPVAHEGPRNFTECARLCKAALRECFLSMVAAVVPGFRDVAYAEALLGEDELGGSDRAEELDNEGYYEDYEEDYGAEQYDDWGYFVAPFGWDGYHGEQDYDYEEMNLEDFVEWEDGEDDEDGGIPHLEVHIGPLRYIVP